MNKTRLSKTNLECSIGSRRELDNLEDLNSVVTNSTQNMSWHGEERVLDFKEHEYPGRPGTAPPPHHHNKSERESKRKKKKKNKNLDSSNLALFDDNIDDRVKPLPEPQMDVPIFSVSAPQGRPPIQGTSLSINSKGSGTSPHAETFSSQHPSDDHFKYKKRKKRHHSKRSEKIPHIPLDDVSVEATNQKDALSSVLKNTLIAYPEASSAAVNSNLHSSSSRIHTSSSNYAAVEDRIETEFLQGKLVPSLQSSPTHEGLKIETKDDDSDHPSEKDDSIGSHGFKNSVIRQIERSQSRQLVGKNSKDKNKLISQRETANFIVSQIKQRDCCIYVKKHKGGGDDCECGHAKSWHVDRNMDVSDEGTHIWHQKTHTEEGPCDSFGQIHFRGFGTNVLKSPYVRVDFKTPVSVVWELMIKYWKMPEPRLLLSITGGAQRFQLKPRLSSLLKQGLVEAAMNTGAWIVTGGTASGVMEFVGEALRDHMAISSMGSQVPCVALGIAVWGCVANNLALDGEGEQGLWPATYAIEDVIHPARGMASLDPNHTHFLLVDDGREKVFGAEIPLRSELEHYISAVGTTGVAQGQTIPTPVVLIVVEGGVNTMETVFQSNKRNTPVVVINGSGRAADILALAFKITADPANPDKSKFLPDFEDIMREAVTRTFVWKAHDKDKDRKIQNCIDSTVSALKRRNLINIFNLDESDSVKDIDRAILYALLKANKFNCNSQLALALAWNRCDIARQQIFTAENRTQWKLKDLYDAMFTALVQNRADFVQLFMDTGVDLKKFLNIKTLWNLYCNCLSVEDDGEASILRNIITYTSQGWSEYLRLKPLEEWTEFPKEGLLHCINRAIIHLLKDESFDFYMGDKYFVSDEEASMEWKGDRAVIQPLLERIHSKNKDNFMGSGGQGHGNSKQSPGQTPRLDNGGHSRSSRVKQRLKMKETFDFERPERDLFIFSVLFNRRQLADLFLHQGTDHLGMSLFGSSLLKALADQADMDEEDSVSLDLMQHSLSMEMVAKAVLDECYARSRQDAHLLLTRQIKQLGDMSCLLHVDRQHLMEFAEHSACQTKLSSIWKGSLSLHTSEFKVFLTLCLPFLIVFMKFNKGTSRIGFESEDSANQASLLQGQQQQDNGNIHSEENVDTTTPRFAQSQNMPKDKTKRTQFREVRIMNCNNRGGLNPLRAFYTFYKAPVSKFMANIISYLIFLGMFSYFLLTNIKPVTESNSPSATEILVWVWFLTLITEEIRQIMIRDQRSLKYKIRNWWSNFWNQFDLLMYCCMLASIVLRYWMEESGFVYVRCVYSVTLAMTYLRFMQFFFAEKNMGPKVIMIRRMLTDLMFFFLILVVFVLSFGVAYHINLFPNSPVSWSILKNVLYYPYFQIYGELFLEDLEKGGEGDCTTNKTIWQEDPSQRCPEENAIVPIMLALYMVLTNILLVNLLIAMFSYTFQTVQDNSTKVWRFYRISLVNEYFDRPTLVPPIIVINHIWRLFRYCLARKGEATKRHNAFSKRMCEDTNLRLTLLEKAAMDMYLATSSIRQNELLDNRVANTAERLDKVMGDLQRIKESVMQQELDRAAEADKAAALLDLAAGVEGEGAAPAASDSMRRKHGIWLSVKKSEKETSSLKEQMRELKTQSAETAAQLAEVTAMLQSLLAQRK
ncbi:hypothetical protein RRG08_036888 [Elysia crispata]|uniref:TRPM SLOG domain-containing protein n=1 Tax=Elysia crispata TaxID=231223 RepID=A0AAE0ZBL2_9GAST|nr:hypothetical protein RRG08_036888 [Elysia crispata]